MLTSLNYLKRITVVAIMSLLFINTSQAAGLMTPSKANLPQLEIRQHHVDVVIEDGYAITTVDQVFYNPNDTTLEAIYSFPVPEKASVGEFTYWINGKPVTGEVVEKKRAREIYQQEKDQGRETAITEKDSYKTFDTSIYPVLAKQDVKVRLVYIQAVHVDLGIGAYVYPLEDGGVDEEKIAFWSYNDAVTEAFSFKLKLRSSYPVDTVRLPSHPQAIAVAQSKQEWEVSLVNGIAAANETIPVVVGENGVVEEKSPASTPMLSTTATTPQVVQHLNKDIVVYWRHQQGLPGSIDMITHRKPDNSRGSFMLTVTPGDDLAMINQGRDWIFVLDLSGSMQGKYQSLVEGVNKGLKRLQAKDRFRVIVFNNTARELTTGYTDVTSENVSRYITLLENTRPGGGTNLYAGLKMGINGMDADRSSAVILVTDGVANVGTTGKKAFLKLLEKRDVRLFTFVMGNSANRPLLDGMTKASNGFALSVSNSDDIVGKLILATEKLTHEAFHDVEVKISGVKVKDMTPARIGSLYRGQQLIVFGHYWGDGSATVNISGKLSGKKKAYTAQLLFPKSSDLNPEIERLWAYASIEDLQNKIDYFGEDADSKQAIVDIAKEYGLVTDYTSMLVVRDEVFQQYNIERNNARRVASEKTARQQRVAAPVQNSRQDTKQPAFSTPRASPRKGGGGAVGPWVLMLLIPLFVAMRKKAISAG